MRPLIYLSLLLCACASTPRPRAALLAVRADCGEQGTLHSVAVVRGPSVAVTVAHAATCPGGTEPLSLTAGGLPVRASADGPDRTVLEAEGEPWRGLPVTPVRTLAPGASGEPLLDWRGLPVCLVEHLTDDRYVRCVALPSEPARTSVGVEPRAPLVDLESNCWPTCGAR